MPGSTPPMVKATPSQVVFRATLPAQALKNVWCRPPTKAPLWPTMGGARGAMAVNMVMVPPPPPPMVVRKGSPATLTRCRSMNDPGFWSQMVMYIEPPNEGEP